MARMTLRERAEQYRDRTFGPYGAPPTREAALNGYLAGWHARGRADRLNKDALHVEIEKQLRNWMDPKEACGAADAVMGTIERAKSKGRK